MGYPKAKSLLCVAKMAYRPALLYLLSGLATIRVSTHTSTNTVTYKQDRQIQFRLRLFLWFPRMHELCATTLTGARTPTLATRTLQRNAQMTSPKSNSTMFLKSRAGRANLDTKFPKPFAWFSVMTSALWVEISSNEHSITFLEEYSTQK